jgi:hypothetical protein
MRLFGAFWANGRDEQYSIHIPVGLIVYDFSQQESVMIPPLSFADSFAFFAYQYHSVHFGTSFWVA